MQRTKLIFAACVILLVVGASLLISVNYAVGYQPEVSRTPTYSEDSDRVVLSTGILAAIIEKSQPMVTFFYQPDGGNVARFRIVYNSILAYNDTGNGLFDEGEALYQAVLSSSEWTAGSMMSLEDSQHGKYVAFTTNASITMTPVSSGQDGHGPGQGGRPTEPVTNWATITFTYMIADKNYTQGISSQFAYVVAGNAELKVDINLTFNKSLPARNITIEQFLHENEDLQQNHVFQLHESTGITVRSSRFREGGAGGLAMHRFSQTNELRQSIAFATNDGVEEGYYSWVPPCNLTSLGGVKSVLNGSASYGTSGSELRLYYSLPYYADCESVYIDPVIGIVEAGFLEAIAGFIVEHSSSLIAGVVVGSIVVVGILYFVSKRESRWEEETVGLENNPYYSGEVRSQILD